MAGNSDSALAEVFVVSDGTGETAANAVRAVMLQFANPWRLRIFGGVRHESEVRRVISEAEAARALIVFSLVDKRVATALISEAAAHGIGTVDLLGPLISQVAQRLHAEPRDEPGLLHGFSDDYFDRVEAVEFAVRHDDGANLHTLHEADIVLTGVSRTSKTPLTMYLAQRGYRTGNVPLVPGIDAPQRLLEVEPKKVFGLMIDAGTLLTIRQARLQAIGAAAYSPSYADPDEIVSELRRARRLIRTHGWSSIDITGRAVEENASRIIEMFQSDPPAGSRARVKQGL